MSTQTSLFGDDEPQLPTVATRSAAAPTNDLELVVDVVRAAADPGYLLQDRPGRVVVLRRVPTRAGVTEPAGDAEARVVEQLLAGGLLRRGGIHQIRSGGRGQLTSAASVLVTESGRSLLRRWAALHSIPTSRTTRAG